MSGADGASHSRRRAHRKSVDFDEDNLAANEEYRRLHPVTMHIDEPKTPYVNPDDLPVDSDGEEYDFDTADQHQAQSADGPSRTWDPKYNSLAREVKEKVSAIVESEGPPARFSASGRPQLAPETVSGEAESERRHKEFTMMRKAVYADEGAKFKEFLASHKNDDEEDEEEE